MYVTTDFVAESHLDPNDPANANIMSIMKVSSDSLLTLYRLVVITTFETDCTGQFFTPISRWRTLTSTATLLKLMLILGKISKNYST